MEITIPEWENYRTMTADKKTQAVNGSKLCQYEWMKEEVNEFYEAIYLEDNDEIQDEAIGLIRTFPPLKNYTFEELKWHACHFILSKCYPFTDLKKALRAVSNLQWCKSARLRIYSFKVLPIYRFQSHILCGLKSSMV